MAKLSPRVLDIIKRYTRLTLERLLQFKLTHDLTRHQIQELRAHWRNVEISLHKDYPISDAGVVAQLKAGEAGIAGLDTDEFLITDEPIAPEDVVGLLGMFPLEAASCAYVFTMLEEYGDYLVSILNPDFQQERKSWHRDIHGGTKLGGAKKREKLEIAFAEPFGLTEYQIAHGIILNLMRIKRERNSFAHSGTMEMHFDEFFRLTVSIICYIYLMIVPNENEILIVHRTGDYTERFRAAEQYRKFFEEEFDRERR
jgi:hypothetical protein